MTRLIAGLVLAVLGCSGRAPAQRTAPAVPTPERGKDATVAAPGLYEQAVIFGLGAPNAFRSGGPAHMVPRLPARMTYAVDPAIAPIAAEAARRVAECSAGAVTLTEVPASAPHDIPIRFSAEEKPEAAALCWWTFDPQGYLTGAALVFYYDGKWFDDASLEHEVFHSVGALHSIGRDDRMGGRLDAGYSGRECEGWRWGVEHLVVGQAPDGRLRGQSVQRPRNVAARF